MKNRKWNIFLSIIILTAIFLFVLTPKENIDACLKGLIVWATALAPALLPFFFFTKLLAMLGVVQAISKRLAPITQKLFHTSGIGAYIYCMSILSGYPMGAKLTADYYAMGLISRGEAHRITTYSSTSGPLFIIGTVGIGMFGSYQLGIIILLSHFIGAFFNGLLYRNYLYNPTNTTLTLSIPKEENILEDTMMSTIKSLLIVGGYVALFFTIITMLNNFHILTPLQILLNSILEWLHLPTGLSYGISNGLIEMTRGCLDIVGTTNHISTLAIPLTFLISFSGLSISCQALAFLRKFRISIPFFFLQKTTHALCSVGVCCLLCYLL